MTEHESSSMTNSISMTPIFGKRIVHLLVLLMLVRDLRLVFKKKIMLLEQLIGNRA